jgi:hypothetical protein
MRRRGLKAVDLGRGEPRGIGRDVGVALRLLVLAAHGRPW